MPEILEYLVQGKIKEFEFILQEMVINMMSYHDVRKDISEISYHSFILGLIAYLQGKYYIKSNRESGFGRYDIAMIPKNKEDLGYIMEFKMVKEGRTKEETADEAKKQVIENKYNQELKNADISNIKQLVVVFENKDVIVEEII
jgi:hypothetical protein